MEVLNLVQQLSLASFSASLLFPSIFSHGPCCVVSSRSTSSRYVPEIQQVVTHRWPELRNVILQLPPVHITIDEKRAYTLYQTDEHGRVLGLYVVRNRAATLLIYITACVHRRRKPLSYLYNDSSTGNFRFSDRSPTENFNRVVTVGPASVQHQRALTI